MREGEALPIIARPTRVTRDDINVLPGRFANKPAYKFVVSGPQPVGRRWRKFFETQAKANAYAHFRRVELATVGTEGAAPSAADRAEFLDCRAKLEPHGVNPREALEMVLPTRRRGGRPFPWQRL